MDDRDLGKAMTTVVQVLHARNGEALTTTAMQRSPPSFSIEDSNCTQTATAIVTQSVTCRKTLPGLNSVAAVVHTLSSERASVVSRAKGRCHR